MSCFSLFSLFCFLSLCVPGGGRASMPSTSNRLRGGGRGRLASATAAAASALARPQPEASALAAIAAGLTPGSLTRDELARFRGRVGDYLAVR
jgi:hypothetical protein